MTIEGWDFPVTGDPYEYVRNDTTWWQVLGDTAMERTVVGSAKKWVDRNSLAGLMGWEKKKKFEFTDEDLISRLGELSDEEFWYLQDQQPDTREEAVVALEQYRNKQRRDARLSNATVTQNFTAGLLAYAPQLAMETMIFRNLGGVAQAAKGASNMEKAKAGMITARRSFGSAAVGEAVNSYGRLTFDPDTTFSQEAYNAAINTAFAGTLIFGIEAGRNLLRSSGKLTGFAPIDRAIIRAREGFNKHDAVSDLGSVTEMHSFPGIIRQKVGEVAQKAGEVYDSAKQGLAGATKQAGSYVSRRIYTALDKEVFERMANRAGLFSNENLANYGLGNDLRMPGKREALAEKLYSDWINGKLTDNLGNKVERYVSPRKTTDIFGDQIVVASRKMARAMLAAVDDTVPDLRKKVTGILDDLPEHHTKVVLRRGSPTDGWEVVGSSSSSVKGLGRKGEKSVEELLDEAYPMRKATNNFMDPEMYRFMQTARHRVANQFARNVHATDPRADRIATLFQRDIDELRTRAKEMRRQIREETSPAIEQIKRNLARMKERAERIQGGLANNLEEIETAPVGSPRHQFLAAEIEAAENELKGWGINPNETSLLKRIAAQEQDLATLTKKQIQEMEQSALGLERDAEQIERALDLYSRDGNVFAFNDIAGEWLPAWMEKTKQLPWMNIYANKALRKLPVWSDFMKAVERMVGTNGQLLPDAERAAVESVEGNMRARWVGKFEGWAQEVRDAYTEQQGMGKGFTASKIILSDASHSVKKVWRKVTGKEPPKKMKFTEFEERVTEAVFDIMDNGVTREADPHVLRAAQSTVRYMEDFRKELYANYLMPTQVGIKRHIEELSDAIEALKRGEDVDLKELVRHQKAKAGQTKLELAEGELARAQRRMQRVTDEMSSKPQAYIHREWSRTAIQDNFDEWEKWLAENMRRNPGKDHTGKTRPIDDASIAERVKSVTKHIMDPDQRAIDDAGFDPEIFTGNNIPIKDSALYKRRLDIPTSFEFDGIKGTKFVEKDLSRLVQKYTHRTSGAIEMARAFGSASGEEFFDQLRRKAIAQGLDEKTAGEMVDNLRSIRDFTLGIEGLTEDPMHWTNRTLRNARYFNILGFMGRVAQVQTIDFGNLIQVAGFKNFATVGGLHLFGSASDLGRQLSQDAKNVIGATSEITLMGRISALMNDNLHFRKAPTKGEQALSNASRKFFFWNGAAWMTDMSRLWASTLMGHDVMDLVIKVADGTISNADMARLRRYGIDRQMAYDIMVEWNKIPDNLRLYRSSTFGNHINLMAMSQWDDQRLAARVGQALRQEMDNIVFSPHASTRPNVLRKEWGRALLLYQTFGIHTTQSFLWRALQQRDQNILGAALSMIAIAGIVNSMRKPDYIETDPEDAVYEAVLLSGVTGVFGDILQKSRDITGTGMGMNMLGIDNKPWADGVNLAAINPITSQLWGFGGSFVNPNATGEDVARGMKYMFPGNNLLWWDYTVHLPNIARKWYGEVLDERMQQ